ncbi:MAG TPA: coiled-coil domain-containing protein [Stellaceae bacterium]|nr:coiled-coil domain-containing protein [Stellaceae bacterium]
MAIDTLKVARRLREAGFTEPQAEAVAEAVRDGADDAELATKQDLKLLSTELRAEIAALRAEMTSEFAAVRAEMASEFAVVRGEMRELEQRLIARIEAAKAEMVGRMFSMITGAVLVNIVAMLGAMFAFAKLLGH